MRPGPCMSVLRASRLLANHSERISRARVRWSSSNSLSTRQWSTPLAKTLAEAIETTGPISIAAYMRQCLTSLDGGYYTSQATTPGQDQFGRKGDFITSPEISQIFGELTGLWIVAEWMKQGKPSGGVDIIEVGPGRGTLMDDMLRTIRNFKALASSIQAVYLVEASPALRETQKRLLCGDRPLKEVGNGYESVSKHLEVPITWCEDIRFVPTEPARTPFIIAHEFFDALPIHAFQSIPPNPSNSASQTLETPTGTLPLTKQSPVSSSNQWRELVITPAPPPSTSTASTSPKDAETHSKGSKPEFQLSIAKASTPNSLLLPTLSQRYKDLLPTANSVIEISPEAQAYAADFARRIGGPSAPGATASTIPPQPPPPSSQQTAPPPPPSTSSTTTTENPTLSGSGAALILDYGPPHTTIPSSTLRGIRQHRHVSPLSSPGLVDISADVDFTALAEAALAASPGVEVHGPVEQAEWLERMGVRARADALCAAAAAAASVVEESEEGGADDRLDREKRIRDGVERLVDRGGERKGEEGGGGMGRIYKVLAIVPERGGSKPVGFGGQLG